MSSSSAPPPVPEGPGSVSGAPNLPAGFADTFTSRYVEANGVRLHAVIGGDGPPLVLVHGWPETWYAWRFVMPAYYIDVLRSDPDALRGSFGFYRAVNATIAQNAQRKDLKLTIPVLAMGGEESAGEGVGNTMRLAADDVQAVVLAGAGHWVAEQVPDELLDALTPFLGPYRDAAARDDGQLAGA